MKCTISASVTLSALAVASVFGQAPDGQRTVGKNLAQILTDTKLWGKDFPKALVTLPQWEHAGEAHIVIMHSQVVSQAGADARKLAPMAETINATSGVGQPVPRPAFAPMLRDAAPTGRPALKAEVVERFKDDQKPRMVATAPGAQFLAPQLDLATVIGELGPPAKTATRVIPTEGDRRPITLTEYSYADDSVVFATSDLDPQPEGNPTKKKINRAILSVPRVAAEVFQKKP
jgi:hypothetical protein